MARIRDIVIDSLDPPALARFWEAVLDGYSVRLYDDAEIARLASVERTPETDPSVAVDGPGPTLFFQEVLEEKSGRNRLHFDLMGGPREDEVERLCALGATVGEERDTLSVMRDPEGNEFCILDPEQEWHQRGRPGRAPVERVEHRWRKERHLLERAVPILRGLNLVVRDMDATVAFYRRLGLEIPDDAVWGTETGAHHVELSMPGGLDLDFDSTQLAKSYNAGWRSDGASRSVIGFSLPTREAVDERYTELMDAGYTGLQPPYDAFWGARYAIIGDPDGNHVGLMSPLDPARRSAPPTV